jgi:hypothetical protein
MSTPPPEAFTEASAVALDEERKEDLVLQLRQEYQRERVALDAEIARLREGIRSALDDGRTPAERLMDAIESGDSPDLFLRKMYQATVDKVRELIEPDAALAPATRGQEHTESKPAEPAKCPDGHLPGTCDFYKPPPAELTVPEVQASWERLRERVKNATGDALPHVTYVRCDSCEAILPTENIDHHSPSGINQCKGGCKPPPAPEAAPRVTMTGTVDASVYGRACDERDDLRAQLAAAQAREKDAQAQASAWSDAARAAQALYSDTRDNTNIALAAANARADKAERERDHFETLHSDCQRISKRALTERDAARRDLAEAVELLRGIYDAWCEWPASKGINVPTFTPLQQFIFTIETLLARLSAAKGDE